MAIAVDLATDGGVALSTDTLTFAHTCTGTNLILYIGFMVADLPITDNVTSVTFNGVAAALVDKVSNTTSEWVYLYQLIAPATGTHDVVITIGETVTTIVGGCVSYTGAKQTAQPDDSNTGRTPSGTSLSVSATTTTNNDWLVMQTRDVSAVVTAGANTTLRLAENANPQAQVAIWDSNGALSIGAHALAVTAAGSDDIRGVLAAFSPAIVGPTSDTLTGPTSGSTGSPSTNFTITLDAPAVSTVTFTPSGTVGTNTFSPTNPQITSGNSTVTFTDTAASDGTHVVTVTNDGGLTDIGSINYATTTTAPTSATLTGPTSGTTGQASTNFTITLDHPAQSTITFTPAGTVGTNTFSPTNPQITSGNSTVTFTDTASTTGTHVVSITNDGGLTNIGTVNYTTAAAPTSATLTGPTSGTTGSASSNFTVTLNHPAFQTVTITPAGTVGTNTFSPTNPTIGIGSTTTTFTDTASSNGTHVVSITNDRGLTNVGTVNYATTTPTTVRILVRCPFLVTDTLGTKSCQVQEVSSGSLVDVGSAITTGFVSIPNITNGWWLPIDVAPNNADGSFAGIAVFSNINGSGKAVVELYSPPTGTPSSLIIVKVAPFLSSDIITTPGYQLFDQDGNTSGSHVTSGIIAISGVTNGFCTKLTLTPGSNNGIQDAILWDGG